METQDDFVNNYLNVFIESDKPIRGYTLPIGHSDVPMELEVKRRWNKLIVKRAQ